jgi:hypothetical protein
MKNSNYVAGSVLLSSFLLSSFAFSQDSALAASITLGPYDVDVTYTVWATNTLGKRTGDPVAENEPLKKGASKKVDCGQSTHDCSKKIGKPLASAGSNNSFDLIATTTGDPTQTEALDPALLNLIGTDVLILPSIFDVSDPSINLVGFIDVTEYIGSGTDFTFDPNNLQTFNFVDGVSSELPGFVVAATTDLDAYFDDVFTFVDGVGPQLISGSNAVLLTGTAIADGQIAVQAPVPEPLTLLGAGTVLGFGAFFKRKLSKKQ